MSRGKKSREREQARLVNGWRAISPDKEWRGDFQQRERRWKKHTGLPAPPNQWTDELCRPAALGRTDLDSLHPSLSPHSIELNSNGKSADISRTDGRQFGDPLLSDRSVGEILYSAARAAALSCTIKY